MKIRCVWLVLIWVFLQTATSVRADFSSVPEMEFFNTNNRIRTMTRVGDTLYIGGDFTKVGKKSMGQAVPFDLNSQTFYRDFTPVSGVVSDIVPDGKGGWYLGGQFTKVGSYSQSYLAHMNSDFAMDSSWRPVLDGVVNKMVVYDGILYVGGYFTTVSGSNRAGVAAFNVNTGGMASWDPQLTYAIPAAVYDLKVAGGLIYIAGLFSTVKGQSRTMVAAVDPVTAQPTNWSPVIVGDGISEIEISNNRAYLTGSITTINGVAKNGLVAVNLTTGGNVDWTPITNIGNCSIAPGTMVISRGILYVGGMFESSNCRVMGQLRDNLAAFDAETGELKTWNPSPNGQVNKIYVHNGKLYFEGNYTTFSGQDRAGGVGAVVDELTKTLLSTDNWQYTKNTTAVSFSGNIAYISDGSDFGVQNGMVSRNGLAAIDLLNQQITAWNPGVGITQSQGMTDIYVLDILAVGDSLFAGGLFSAGNANGLASFNLYNGAQNNWNPNIASVKDLEADATSLYIGGDFSAVNGTTRHGLAAFSLSTGQLGSWGPTVKQDWNEKVTGIKIKDGVIFVGANDAVAGVGFTIAGQNRRGVAAVKTDGTLLNWSPNLSSGVGNLALDGNVLMANGSFSTVNGESHNQLAKFNITDALNPVLESGWTGSIDLSLSGTTTIVPGQNLYIVPGSSVNGQTRTMAGMLSTLTGGLSGWNPDFSGTLAIDSLMATNHDIFIGSWANVISDNKLVSGLIHFSDLTVSNLSVTPGSTSAIISWTTNNAASSRVDFGLTTSTDNYTSETNTTPRVTSHSVVLDNLKSCTMYYYRVRSIDSAGAIVFSPENRLVTNNCPSTALSQMTYSQISTTGGELYMKDHAGVGIGITVPSQFASQEAVFQVKKINSIDVLANVGSPSNSTGLTSLMFHLEALTGVNQVISTFNQQVSLNFYYDPSEITATSLTGITIQRWDGSAWHQLSGCTMDSINHIISCTTFGFSTFGIFSTSAASLAASGSSNSGGSRGAEVCTRITPNDGVDLFQIDAKDKEAKLYYVPKGKPYDKFVVKYGPKVNNMPYGLEFNQSEKPGVHSLAIYHLKPGTTYYFSIRAGNGCATGEWSQVLKIKTNRSKRQKVAKFYKDRLESTKRTVKK